MNVTHYDSRHRNQCFVTNLMSRYIYDSRPLKFNRKRSIIAYLDWD